MHMTNVLLIYDLTSVITLATHGVVSAMVPAMETISFA